MNKSILVTGVAGSGGSRISSEMKKFGYKPYDIENIKGLFLMVDKKTGKASSNFNKKDLESVKRHHWICDKNKLRKLLYKNPKGIVFYCGIASNVDDLISLFDEIFLLKVSQKKLNKRLSTRKSNDFGRDPKIQKHIFS